MWRFPKQKKERAKGRYYIVRLKIQGSRHERRTSNNSIFDRWEKLGGFEQGLKEVGVHKLTHIDYVPPFLVPPAEMIRRMQEGGESRSRALLALGPDGNAFFLIGDCLTVGP